MLDKPYIWFCSTGKQSILIVSWKPSLKLNKRYVDVIYLKATIFRVNKRKVTDGRTLLVIPEAKLFNKQQFWIVFSFLQKSVEKDQEYYKRKYRRLKQLVISQVYVSFHSQTFLTFSGGIKREHWPEMG